MNDADHCCPDLVAALATNVHVMSLFVFTGEGRCLVIIYSVRGDAMREYCHQ